MSWMFGDVNSLVLTMTKADSPPATSTREGARLEPSPRTAPDGPVLPTRAVRAGLD
jgi:hypothetical protein